ncbi:MAG TPA: hypothetical protein VF310_02415 [Vicinamibacteria bacterium]
MSSTRAIDVRRLLPIGPRGWLVRTPGFTAREVRDLLRAGAADARGRAVGRCAARAGDWLPATPDLVRCPTHYRDRLARIVYWYARGDALDEIARRVSFFGTPWGIERVLDTACHGIAACLNRQPDLYGYDPRR